MSSTIISRDKDDYVVVPATGNALKAASQINTHFNEFGWAAWIDESDVPVCFLDGPRGSIDTKSRQRHWLDDYKKRYGLEGKIEGAVAIIWDPQKVADVV